MSDYYELIVRDEEAPWFPASELKVGQLAQVYYDVSPYDAHTVLRCDSVLVSLTNANDVWKTPDALTFLVRLLKPPEQVVLIPRPDGESEDKDGS